VDRARSTTSVTLGIGERMAGSTGWGLDRADRRPAALRGVGAVVGMLDVPAGAYVHIPFCERICPFCPYNKVRARADLAQRYFAALTVEIDAVTAEHRRRFGTGFSSLYIGGGTPTLYPDALADILARVPTTGECAVEVLPNHATPERLDHLTAIGVTAVSIGAQSFHDGVLHHLGRPHDAAMALASVQAAVGRFACVDVDLIVDVALEAPGPARVAPPGTFLDDVRTCFAAGVDQVSTYPLMRFGYTPFGRARHQRRREQAVLAQVTDLAAAMGYERRSVWTFNRTGSPPYTSITRRRFLGMGASATSVTGRDFLVNHFGIAAYTDAVEAGLLPLARWLHLGRWGGAGYELFWQAYAGTISPAVLAHAYGRDVAVAARAGLTPARWARLLHSQGGDLRLTAKGFDVYHDLERAVTYQLIEPLWAEMLREHADEHADIETGCPLRPAADRAESSSRSAAQWAKPENARHGRLWHHAAHAMERQIPDLQSCPAPSR